MRRALVVVALVLVLAGCSAEVQDRKGGNGQRADHVTDVDSAEVFRNIDNFPNVERLCVDGLAFVATTSNDGQTASNLLRVPEWDRKCGPQ